VPAAAMRRYGSSAGAEVRQHDEIVSRAQIDADVPRSPWVTLAPKWAPAAHLAPCVASCSMSVSEHKRGVSMRAHRHFG
jgi:hypothetical protein